MTANVGSVDRIIRAALGLALLSLLLLGDGNMKWLGLIGIVPIATAALGVCPLYSVFGISTCSARQ